MLRALVASGAAASVRAWRKKRAGTHAVKSTFSHLTSFPATATIHDISTASLKCEKFALVGGVAGPVFMPSGRCRMWRGGREHGRETGEGKQTTVSTDGISSQSRLRVTPCLPAPCSLLPASCQLLLPFSGIFVPLDPCAHGYLYVHCVLLHPIKLNHHANTCTGSCFCVCAETACTSLYQCVVACVTGEG